jgi:choline dehydrogenase-like flavoprotein
MSQLKDPIREGLARGWKVMGGPHAPAPEKITCDVAIIGSGAGAGITAELLAKAGLQVVIVEEGPLKSSSDFNQKESEAYPSLYQESAARKTEDKAINILQGRCVGGSTTVNWTSSFRTPASTLQFWQDNFGLDGYTAQALAPYFAQGRAAAEHYAVACSPEREQRPPAQGRGQAGNPCVGHLAQRQGMLEPGLLRPWLPDQCQAIDARHDHTGCTGSGRTTAG